MDLLRSAIQCLRSNVILGTAFLFLLSESYCISTDTAHAQVQDPAMKIFFLEVQGGSSNLVILPNGKTLLIDGGRESPGGEIVMSLLQEQNITKIDTIVATHAHSDHIGGLIPLINNVSVGEILDPGVKDTGYPYNEYIYAIESSNVYHKAVREGDEILLDPSVKIEVIHPPRWLPVGVDATHENPAFLNNFSIVLKLSYGEFDILFTGDILAGVQESFLDKDVDVEVMTAPHHGSPNAQNIRFLIAVSPEVVIISPGFENDETPNQETSDKLNFIGVQEILNTRLQGTIVLVTDGHTYEIDRLGSPEPL